MPSHWTDPVRRALVAGFIFTAAGAPLAAAQDLTASAIVIPTESTRQLPVYVADKMGFWAEEGLDVEVSVVRGVAATNAVVSGSVDFAYTGSLAMQRAAAAGQPLMAIAMMQNTLSHQIVLRKDVAERLTGSAEEKARVLEGLTLAVDTLDGQPHAYLKYVLARAGLDPDRDITVTPVQPPAMSGALEARAVDGIVFSKPWTDLAVTQTGAEMWLNSETDAPELRPFASSVVVTRRDLCAEKPEICRGMVAGLAKAVNFIRTDKEGAKAVLKERFDRLSEAALSDAVEDALHSTGETLELSVEALANTQSFLAQSGLLPAERMPGVETLFTNEFHP